MRYLGKLDLKRFHGRKAAFRGQIELKKLKKMDVSSCRQALLQLTRRLYDLIELDDVRMLYELQDVDLPSHPLHVCHILSTP